MVYAGIDPVIKKQYYLDEVVPAGPKAAAEAEKLRTEFLNQVDEKRSSRTRATVSQLLDRYFELVKIEKTTRTGSKSLVRNHIQPLLGDGPPQARRRNLGLVLPERAVRDDRSLSQLQP